MNTKQSGRRRFLKEGGVLAGMAVGAMGSTAAQGQTLVSEESEEHPKDTHAYGERSRFENSERYHYSPPGSNGREPDVFTQRTPIAGYVRDHHAVRAPLHDKSLP